MNNQKRLGYLLVSIIVILAASVFLRTWVDATAYVSDSGSYGTAYVAIQPPIEVSTSTESAEATDTQSASNDQKPAPVSMPADYPVRLSIPGLKIDAAVQYLGVNAKGNLGVPNNFTDVGWYAAGTIPGDIGSAVIDGHVDNGLALAGVFKHLASIAVGDDIYVTDHDGTAIHFIVMDIQSYDYKNAPVGLIFDQRDGAFLKLITCGGTWVPGDRTYDQRVVVTAVLAA